MTEVEKSRHHRHLWAFLRVVVAVIAVWWLFRGEDLGELVGIFKGLNILVFIGALVLYVIAQLIFVLRWWVMLRAQHIRIDYGAAVKLHFLGLFYNNCLPGSVGGDLLRAWYVTKHTEKKVEAVLSVFVDRAIGLSCTVVIAGFCYWLILRGGAVEEGLQVFHGFDSSSIVVVLAPAGRVTSCRCSSSPLARAIPSAKAALMIPAEKATIPMRRMDMNPTITVTTIVIG